MVPSSAAVKMVGDSARCLSLACCVSFCILLALYFLIAFDVLSRFAGRSNGRCCGVAIVTFILSEASVSLLCIWFREVVLDDECDGQWSGTICQ